MQASGELQLGVRRSRGMQQLQNHGGAELLINQTSISIFVEGGAELHIQLYYPPKNSGD